MKLISNDELYHFNPFHDKLGRFASRNGGVKIQNSKNIKSNKNNKNNKNNKHGLSKNQKRALAIGGAALATALASYGGYQLYKNGKLDSIKKLGKNKVQEAVDEAFKNGPEIRLASGVQELPFGFYKTKREPSLKNVAAGIKAGISPFQRKQEGVKNSVSSSIAGFLTSEGYFGVRAKTTSNDKYEPLGRVVRKCFKDATVLDGLAMKFGESPQDAEKVLVQNFGNDAKGIASVLWKGERGNTGHTINWELRNGKAIFADCQSGKILNDPFEYMSGDYWNNINKYGNLTLARLDDAKPVYEELSKIVNPKGWL